MSCRRLWKLQKCVIIPVWCRNPDVAQAKSVYHSTLASIPSVESGIIQYTNALAVLLGLYPQDVASSLGKQMPVAGLYRTGGSGEYWTTLVAASRCACGRKASECTGCTAWGIQVGLVTFFFFLNGSLGYASHDMKDLTKRSSMTWSIAPSISWTIFNGGQRLNAVKLQRAQLDETINRFNNTVLTAVQEVDNAMSSYRNSIKQIVACREMVNQGKEAFKLSDLYKQGWSLFQMSWMHSVHCFYENALVQAQGYSLICLVQMYQALERVVRFL